MNPARVVRTKKVAERADDALVFLQENGPSTLASISSGIGMNLHHTRYAMVILANDKKAYISGFMRLQRDGDNIPRHVAVFSAGEGENAKLARSWSASACTLDFESTLFLQPIYMEWMQTRTPDFVQEDDVS